MKLKEVFGSNEIIILVLLLAGVTVSIQYHSIFFWKELIGDSGVVWSITIELVAIFAWFCTESSNKNKLLIWIVAIGATLIALSGPAVRNMQPIVEEISKVDNLLQTFEDRLKAKDDLIADNRSNLEMARLNSKDRTGWKGSIDRGEENITKLILEKEEMLKNKPSYSSIVLSSVTVFLITLALIVFQLASVLISRHLAIAIKSIKSGNSAPSENTSHSTNKQTQAKEAESDKPVVQLVRQAAESERTTKVVGIVEDDLTHEEKADKIIEISNFIAKYKDDHNYSTIRDMAKAGKVNEKNLSLLINHSSNLVKKESNPNIRTISYDKAVIIGDTFGF